MTPIFWIVWAGCIIVLGRLASARHYLNKAAEGESSAEIFAHLGEVLWELGNHEEAKKNLAQGFGAVPPKYRIR